MFILCANKSKLTVRQRETVASGSVNACDVQFEFSPDWNGLTRTAVFNAGAETRSVRLDESGQCVIPWEVLTQRGRQLSAGVYGKRGDALVLPTIWANLGTVLEGVPTDSEGTRPPTPDLWEQKLAGKGNRLDYTSDGSLGLYAGDKLLSSVSLQGGTLDHRALAHRDAEDQHPIEAVAGLSSRLARTMTVDNALSVSEILKIMEENENGR